jgi:hypothetical protein
MSVITKPGATALTVIAGASAFASGPILDHSGSDLL